MENKMTYRELKEIGIFNLMPNGFNLYLDDDILDNGDASKCYFMYDIDENAYMLSNNPDIRLTSEELEDSQVTCIGSDLIDVEVPALWIIPTNEWYKKYGGTIWADIS